MRCTRPRTVGFQADGKTICWSQKKRSKEFATFQLPCSKCIQCRLEYSRQWSIRALHESKLYKNNAFITLTYSDENLVSSKLIYEDFQNFMKRLRKLSNEPIGMMVAGEYGEQTKRPHWHAIIFNWQPADARYKYTTDRGDKVFSSETLAKLWPHGISEFGSVTQHSAGYVARYAAKKLVHGTDQEIEALGLKPIFKTSNKHAIGKKWLERYWDTDCFNKGLITLPDGSTCAIPRYYEKWLKDNHPQGWLRYVTQVKIPKMEMAETKAKIEHMEETEKRWAQPFDQPNPVTRKRTKEIILENRFNQLNKFRKL